MGKFMIIFPRQITAEQMGFSFEFLVARIIFALGRTFQNLEKKNKNIPPKHTHKLVELNFRFRITGNTTTFHRTTVQALG